MNRGKQRAFTGFGISLLLLFAFAVFVKLNFRTVIVDGHSMEPTLQPEEKVLVSSAYWLVGGIRHKDIVVLKDPGGNGYIIKRVAFLGGERIPVDKWPETRRLEEGEFILPEGSLYVLGDNALQSEDSRRFGPVKMNQVIGKVVVRP